MVCGFAIFFSLYHIFVYDSVLLREREGDKQSVTLSPTEEFRRLPEAIKNTFRRHRKLCENAKTL